MFLKYWSCVVVILTLGGSAVIDLENPVEHKLSPNRLRILNKKCKTVVARKFKFFTPQKMRSSRNKPTLPRVETSGVTRNGKQKTSNGETMLPVTPGLREPFVTNIHDLPKDPRPTKDLQTAPQNKFPTWSGRVGLGRIAFPGRSPPMMPFPDQNDILLSQSATRLTRHSDALT